MGAGDGNCANATPSHRPLPNTDTPSPWVATPQGPLLRAVGCVTVREEAAGGRRVSASPGIHPHPAVRKIHRCPDTPARCGVARGGVLRGEYFAWWGVAGGGVFREVGCCVRWGVSCAWVSRGVGCLARPARPRRRCGPPPPWPAAHARGGACGPARSAARRCARPARTEVRPPPRGSPGREVRRPARRVGRARGGACCLCGGLPRARRAAPGGPPPPARGGAQGGAVVARCAVPFVRAGGGPAVRTCGMRWSGADPGADRSEDG
ncbi:hypothetical protein HNP84_009275 [Thermocatellispora tengchongensis]|uniref:Uncharacterized protein n=1 Tax=Thermocatellispora tengchongensis TaxID=1073253 RepID=A0A840PK86_9ACTN|nr:hypothetical protein [Thermocatellispora tengchongensis]